MNGVANLVSIYNVGGYDAIATHLYECADGHAGLPVDDSVRGYTPELLDEIHANWHSVSIDNPTEKNH